jgi:antitoxin (DNA-binding transcriptional repressor) of toxin-antitoxin stability system
MKTISMVELRKNSEAVIAQLKRGLPLTLSYRGKPIAKLIPISPDKDQIQPDDPLYRLAEHADAGAVDNHSLTNEQIDQTLYGQG